MSTTQFAQKYTDEERAAYKQAQREQAQAQLTQAVASMQCTEGFAAWLRARARFHAYSFHNSLLILAQLPEATRVASAKVWRELGRYPAKGSKALRVFAPMEWHRDADGQQPGELNMYGQVAFRCEKHNRVCVKAKTFKLVPVFDVSQTDGDELPEPPRPEPIEGDSHAHLEPKLIALADELGFSVTTEELDEHTGGYCDANAKRIVVASGHAPNSRIRVLVHEIAHALGVSYKDYGRSAAETIVEAATYIVLAGQGIDVSTSSVPYVAGWSGADGHEKLTEFAKTIDEIARRIESALA